MLALLPSALSWHATTMRPQSSGLRPIMSTAVDEPMVVAPTSLLSQLAEMTTLSIDTGDLDIIAQFAATGTITDATTNPLFVSQALTQPHSQPRRHLE